jgi:hypothetical protein
MDWEVSSKLVAIQYGEIHIKSEKGNRHAFLGNGVALFPAESMLLIGS